jgi:ribosomal-protein-alanine N-acetyltransferase
MKVTPVLVRAAGSDDGAAVVALERDALGPDAWSENLVLEGVDGAIPTTLFVVAESDDHICGYAAVSVVADVAELQRIAVGAAYRRTGVASALLARVEREAAVRHADRLVLEVRDDNVGALAFYTRHRFTELSRRHDYYADGTTAIVLVRDVDRMGP